MQTEPSLTPVGVGNLIADTAQISVVIPAYNASAFLPATLESIFKQSCLPGEVIVVDDGSTDDTVAVAESFGARVISVRNGGPSAARNVGTSEARGEYIAYLDADDVWTSDKLAVQFAALKSFGRPAFSFTDYRMFDERGVHKRRSELRHHWAFRKTARERGKRDVVLIASDGVHPVLYDSYIPPSSVIVRRADCLAVGGYDESLRVTEDFEFYLRLFKLVPAVAVMQPLLLYRRHAQQATSNAPLMKRGLFDVASRVAAVPDRYPLPDARYIAETEYLRYYDLGIEQVRCGQMDEAVVSLSQSVAARRTVRGSLALLAANICRSTVGRSTFNVVRAVWRSRPGRR